MWNDDVLLAGLVSQGLVRVRVTGNTAAEVARIALRARIREVEQGPGDTLWVLEEGGWCSSIRREREAYRFRALQHRPTSASP